VGLFARLLGTTASFFQLGGPSGPRLKNNGGAVDHRNSADSAYVNARGADPLIANDLVTLEYLEAYTEPSFFGSIDVVLSAHHDDATGTVSGLAATPLHVVGNVLYEEGVTVQSGMEYSFHVTQLNAAGFNWKLKVLGDEFWPGPGSVTIKVNYAWSSE
jgi:hypothetical protein